MELLTASPEPMPTAGEAFAWPPDEGRIFLKAREVLDKLFAEPLKGQQLVSARKVLWSITSLAEALAIARLFLSEEIADRLAELRDQPYDMKAGEQPIEFESVRWFLDYCVRRGEATRPLMTTTPDGIIQADWRPDDSRRLVIRFFSNGRAWIAIRAADTRGSWETAASHLLTPQSLVRVPEWA